MVDWSLARVPDFTGAALAGYAAGRQIGRQKRTDAALQAFSADPDAGIMQAEAFDPELGERLRGINRKRQVNEILPRVTRPTQNGIELDSAALNELYAIDPDQAMQISKFVSGARKDQLEQVAEHGKIKASAAIQLLKFPAGPEREAAYQRLRPELEARGFAAQDLDAARLDDASLNQDRAFGMTVSELADEARVKWVPIGENGLAAFDAYGNPIGNENPYAQPPSSPPTSATGSSDEFKGVQGERVTSTTRSPSKNAAVGGVPNSFHLTGEARDSVPPKGMSMDRYAAELRRLNPDKDVINEGDHVHMEPRTRRANSTPVRVASKSEFDRLPSGAEFVAPDGSVRRKP